MVESELCPMARATKAEKARLLNAAYRLLGQEMKRAEATRHLGREQSAAHARRSGLSLGQVVTRAVTRQTGCC